LQDPLPYQEDSDQLASSNSDDENDDNGRQLDRRLVTYAAKAFPDELGSKNRAEKALKRGELLFNNIERVEGCRRIKRGDILTLKQSLPLPPPEKKLQARMNFIGHMLENGLRTLYEDDDIAAVYKPSGVHTKHASNFRYLAFEDALPAILTPPSSQIGSDRLPLPIAVHRLDVRVCGLVLVAKTRSAMISLSNQFEYRRVHKRYEALVIGRPEPSQPSLNKETEDDDDVEKGSFLIDEPINVEGRGLLNAQTTLRVLSTIDHLHWGALSHVDLRPKTGRTHQLRIHCAGLGCPIVGDDLYWKMGDDSRQQQRNGKNVGEEEIVPLPSVRKGQGGLYLQSVGATFVHPRTGVEMTIEAPVANKFNMLLGRARRANEYDTKTAPAA